MQKIWKKLLLRISQSPNTRMLKICALCVLSKNPTLSSCRVAMEEYAMSAPWAYSKRVSSVPFAEMYDLSLNIANCAST
jgi:hypothetical protein